MTDDFEFCSIPGRIPNGRTGGVTKGGVVGRVVVLDREWELEFEESALESSANSLEGVGSAYRSVSCQSTYVSNRIDVISPSTGIDEKASREI